MDYSLSSKSYSPNQFRSIDNTSQVTNIAIPIKPIDLLCISHHDEPCNNYCVQSKCYQPLCSECIEDHLLHHKKHGYSDLAVKSMKGVRRQCVSKLSLLIDELLKRLGQLDAPPNPQKLIQQLQYKLEQARNEAHQVVQQQFGKLRQSLKIKISQSTTVLRGMMDIHMKLEGLIQQLRETLSILSEGKKSAFTVPQCIKKTLTLNDQILIDTFEKESTVYETKRRKAQFDILFNTDIFRQGVNEAIGISAPKNISGAEISNQKTKYRNNQPEELKDFGNGSIPNMTLPSKIQPQENSNLLYFFESGSSSLHFIEVDGKKKGKAKIVSISQFIVPSFHASIMSNSAQFIYMSGGVVELNGAVKSPLFMKYSIKAQTIRKDFARVAPRSSHSLCQDKNGDIFILGGYGQNPNTGDPLYLTMVERVNQRTGKVQFEAESKWGGSNLAVRCRQFILKACEQGVQLFSSKTRQWIIAEIRYKSRGQFTYFKNAGCANLQQGQLVIFGGYNCDEKLTPIDDCFFWKLASEGGKPIINIAKLACKLPIAQAFDNSKAVVDQRGFFSLQNVEDDEQSCLENQRRLLRFDLKDGGEWRIVDIINEQQ